MRRTRSPSWHRRSPATGCRSGRARGASASRRSLTVFADLMTGTLGYSRFAAQGGDWGGITASRMGYAHAGKLLGIHVNLLAVRRDTNMLTDPTPEERKYLDELAYWLKEETGYQWIQGTKPQTLS